jgi:hypothetical protein
VGQQVNLRHRVTVKTAVLVVAAAIQQAAQELARVALLRKALAAAQQDMVLLVATATAMVLQTPLVAAVAALAVQVLRLRFKPTQQVEMAARLILVP